MNAPAPAPGDPAAKVPDGARPVVLLVDDDVPTRLMASGFLGRAGFDVVEARDGLEALERLEAARSDLVLLDIEMPRLDGFETCARLRAIPGYATERRTWRRRWHRMTRCCPRSTCS